MERLERILAIGLMIMLLFFVLPACSAESSGWGQSVTDDTEVAAGEGSSAEASEETIPDGADPRRQQEEYSDTGENDEAKSMRMTISGTPVQVEWENNESVKELASLAEKSPVTIETKPYGGFEQVGSIGATLPSNDTNIKTKAGDIMLYTGSQMVIFYGSNSWAYTRLGRITDKSKSELQDLLGGYGVTVTIAAE